MMQESLNSLSMQDLVGRLTLDEMVAQMSHGGGTSSTGDLNKLCALACVILYGCNWIYRPCTSHISSWH